MEEKTKTKADDLKENTADNIISDIVIGKWLGYAFVFILPLYIIISFIINDWSYIPKLLFGFLLLLVITPIGWIIIAFTTVFTIQYGRKKGVIHQLPDYVKKWYNID
ncbi:MAG: hypothetical protein FWG20_03540 [Candidatus Cloacimonetes bacterium]|nr:hypothetical protein [Candidatus Cloacimonadota bacterium]